MCHLSDGTISRFLFPIGILPPLRLVNISVRYRMVWSTFLLRWCKESLSTFRREFKREEFIWSEVDETMHNSFRLAVCGHSLRHY